MRETGAWITAFCAGFLAGWLVSSTVVGHAQPLTNWAGYQSDRRQAVSTDVYLTLPHVPAGAPHVAVWTGIGGGPRDCRIIMQDGYQWKGGSRWQAWVEDYPEAVTLVPIMAHSGDTVRLLVQYSLQSGDTSYQLWDQTNGKTWGAETQELAPCLRSAEVVTEQPGKRPVQFDHLRAWGWQVNGHVVSRASRDLSPGVTAGSLVRGAFDLWAR